MRIPTDISHFYTMIRGEDNMLAKKRGLGYIVLCLLMFLMIGVHVRAEEINAVLGTLQVLSADAEVKESPDMDSATVGTLQAGTAVIVESQDGEWTKVLYQNIEGYISDTAVGSLESYIAEDSENLKNLEQEMMSVAEEEQRITEEYELILKQRRTSLIWGIVIAILIIGIFGVGVVAAIKNSKEEEMEEQEQLTEEKTESEEKIEETETEQETDTDIDIEEITDEKEDEEQ